MAKDFENTEDGDILVDAVKGIILRDDCEEQLLMKLMFLNKGSLKYSPMTGAGVRQLPNARTGQDVVKNINQQLELDGWTDGEVSFKGEKLGVYANRNL